MSVYLKNRLNGYFPIKIMIEIDKNKTSKIL